MDVIERILRDAKLFGFYSRGDLLAELAAHTKLPKLLSIVYGAGRQFHKTVEIRNYIEPKDYIFWLIGQIRGNIELVKRFLALREKMNTALLSGEADGALLAVEQTQALSESWWAIETTIHIQKELGGTDTKEIIKSLYERFPHLNLASLTQDYLFLSESRSIYFYINNTLGRMKEYKTSGLAEAIAHGAIESVQRLPVIFDPDREASLEGLFSLRNFSIIDQYMALRQVLADRRARLEPISIESELLALFADVRDEEMANLLSVDHTSDPWVSRIVMEYTYGRYDRVTAEIQKYVSDHSSKVFGMVEIYARAKIYTGIVGSGNTFFDRIADEFARILQLDSKSFEREAYLEKLCIKFRNEPWAKSLLFHLAAMRNMKAELPLELIRRQTFCLGGSNTPKATWNARERIELPFVEDGGDVPSYRLLKYGYCEDSDVHERAKDIFPIWSDYLQYKSRFLMASGKLNEAIKFCVTEYIENSVAFSFLPVSSLCEAVFATDPEDIDSCKSALLIYDIYSKQADSRFDEAKGDLFERLLMLSGTHQPSKVFAAKSLSKMDAYFLRHICVPTMLDGIIEYGSNDEVIHERVAIIDILIASKIDGYDTLRAEKDKVLENLFAEKLRAKIESGKLFVDVQALEAHRKHVYQQFYEQAKSLEGGVNLEPLPEGDNNSIDSKDLLEFDGNARVAIAASEKTSLLAGIFNQAVADFALNENYGLDKYLSAEVRHIVFVTQLRSCFEKSKLITVQKDGEYLSNDFWVNKYHYVYRGIIEDIDKKLTQFSAKVDAILAEVNDKFRVSFGVSKEELTGVFDFSPWHNRIVDISTIVDTSDSFDQFFTRLINYMWDIAGQGAHEAQRLVNDVLLNKIGSAIEELEFDINQAKGDVPLIDLMQEVKNARSNFTKEIELVLNWFRFVGSEDVHTLERLGVVIEATVSSFESIFQHRGKKLIARQMKSGLLLTYSEARSLFIALFTALENALKYGADDSGVLFEHTIEAGRDRLLVKNQLGGAISDPQTFIDGEKAKWNEENSNLSTAEGGTGLYKIHNLLTNASAGFTFNIEISDENFFAIMEINHEDFGDRRQSA